MIRRDYILRMLEEFFAVLSRLRALQKGQKWGEATLIAEKEVRDLIGSDIPTVIQLSETELLARLIRGEPTVAVREKALMLATLLKEAGEIATGEGRLEEGRACFLKGLHLLLGILAREEAFECPEFVPRVEAFLSALGDSALPLTTLAMLIQHYERLAEFGKAEDALFSMLETQPDSLDLLNFGVGFYRRLEQKSDEALSAGNLPRAEIQAGLAQLARQGGKTARQ